MKINPEKLNASKERFIPKGNYLTVMNEYTNAKAEDSKLIPISQLTAFPKQPFRPYTPEKLAELAEDIAEHGVISPVFLRPYSGSYQILSGHNRIAAAKLAGLTEVPAIVQDVDDKTAVKIMVNSNLLQRQELLHSEKAWAYRLRLEAMKRQGARTDLTCAQVAHKLDKKRARDILAEQEGESRDQIRRYIRLTYLIPPLLELVDTEKIPFTAGVSLSYLEEAKQQAVWGIMQSNSIGRVSRAQAEELRTFAEELDDNLILRIFGILQSPAKGKSVTFKVPSDLLPANASKKLFLDPLFLERFAELVKEFAER